MTKYTKSIFLALAVFAMGQFSFAQGFFGGDAVPHVNNPLPFSKGINLSTWLEPYEPCNSGVTHFGKQDFVNIKNMGAEVIRIPIHFDHWCDNSEDFVIDPLLFKMLDDVVIWAEEIQIYVIFDFHNTGKKPVTADTEKFLLKIWSQMAMRYRNATSYIMYEIYNEPFGISYEDWGEMQERIIKRIRVHDTSHKIIVGGADYNSAASLEMLPIYEDNNLIYSFHDYDPFLFTNQTEEWSKVPHMKKIPYPFDENRMLPCPPEANALERNYYNSYRHDSSEYTMTDTFDKAIAFANARKVPLICTEYGCSMKYTEQKDRVAWYRDMSRFMDQRGITRVAWSYSGDFGIFKKNSLLKIFPKDVDQSILHAMGFEVPTYRIPSWIDDSKKTGQYFIYKNRFSQKVHVSISLPDNGKDANLFRRDAKNGETCIEFPRMDRYNLIQFIFSKPCDFTSLYAKNAKLQFCIKTTEQNLKLQAWFENSGFQDYKWRCTATITNKEVPSDGLWHTFTIPLKDFIDNGCYDEERKIWLPSQGKFLWTDVLSLKVQTDNMITKGIFLKDIEFVFD